MLMCPATDEYTALQKYISTYRDPKAAAAEDKEDTGEKKKTPGWKVSATSLLAASSALPLINLITVLGQEGSSI
jgi:hypothetical protein